nr:hypothetical protein [Mesorhizobium sp. ESP7-2]
MIQGICGRTYFDLSAPPVLPETDLLSLWENRLAARLATVGSTEFALIWRRKTTPAGHAIFRLAPSTRHTNGTGFTGVQWPTPSVANATGGQSSRSGDRKGEMLLSGLMREAEAPTWSTPRASDGEKGGPNQSFTAGGQPLPAQMHQASPWVTPSARDWKDSPGMATTAGDRNRVDQLPRQMMQEPQAMWPTAEAGAFGTSDVPRLPERRQKYAEKYGNNGFGLTLGQMITVETEPTGPTPNGSSATTAKRGAPNPVFAFWLMGFPDEWISGALEAMRSYRRPRSKSSPRSARPSTPNAFD